MYANGYVGTAADSARIRRQEKEREEQRKRHEELEKSIHSKASSMGLVERRMCRVHGRKARIGQVFTSLAPSCLLAGGPASVDLSLPCVYHKSWPFHARTCSFWLWARPWAHSPSG